MAAGGMTRPDDVGRTSLAGRRRDPASDAPGPGPHGGPADPDDSSGRPCWVVVAGADHPGRLHTWRRSGDDPRQWEALVMVWLPASAVRPRRPESDGFGRT